MLRCFEEKNHDDQETGFKGNEIILNVLRNSSQPVLALPRYTKRFIALQ